LYNRRILVATSTIESGCLLYLRVQSWADATAAGRAGTTIKIDEEDAAGTPAKGGFRG